MDEKAPDPILSKILKSFSDKLLVSSSSSIRTTYGISAYYLLLLATGASSLSL